MMREAFARAGITERRVALDKALALFRNHGGSAEEALAAVRAAYALPDQGQTGGANGLRTTAEIGRAADQGQSPGAREGQRPPAEVGGRKVVAGRALGVQQDHAISARPTFTPAEAGRVLQKIAAENAAWRRTAKAIIRIDGDDILDWTIGRALSIARHKGIENYVLSTLGGMFRHERHTKTFREVTTEGLIRSVVQQAKAYADAA
jgi:hypothetical protein